MAIISSGFQPEKNKKPNKEKTILWVGFLLIVAVVVITFVRPSGNKSGESQNQNTNSKIDYPQISAQDLLAKVRNNEAVQILDVRPTQDYQMEHIPNSQNIPLDQLMGNHLSFSSDKSVYILGNPNDDSGSNQAVQILKNKNYNDVSVIAGGLDIWKAKGGSAISFGNPTSFTDQAKVTFITQDDFSKILKDPAQKDGIFILDIRPASSFSSGHIPGAVNISLDSLEKSKDKVPLGKQIYVYGENELDGFQAGVRLFDLNFYSAKVINEGFTKWKEKNLPVEQ